MQRHASRAVPALFSGSSSSRGSVFRVNSRSFFTGGTGRFKSGGGERRVLFLDISESVEIDFQLLFHPGIGKYCVEIPFSTIGKDHDARRPLWKLLHHLQGGNKYPPR